ncbi:hypothetical protein AB2M62_14070 [Sphingomonas sp. MMS12-HWE2-04]|uniref:hypothetical protein n=1 Tax=Sphingomonas sp. MMS12-HWE2-04 TaxID=3234199 RepID=UPI00384E130F
MMRFYARHAGRPRVVPVRPVAKAGERPSERRHDDERLEVALEESFPASDPIAVSRID